MARPRNTAKCSSPAQAMFLQCDPHRPSKRVAKLRRCTAPCWSPRSTKAAWHGSKSERIAAPGTSHVCVRRMAPQRPAERIRQSLPLQCACKGAHLLWGRRGTPRRHGVAHVGGAVWQPCTGCVSAWRVGPRGGAAAWSLPCHTCDRASMNSISTHLATEGAGSWNLAAPLHEERGASHSKCQSADMQADGGVQGRRG